jgi:hypothetical protein
MSTNNAVINNTTTGITNQGIQLITQPYQERITTLEQKLTEVNSIRVVPKFCLESVCKGYFGLLV